MRVGNLSNGQTELQSCLKTLLLRWEQTQPEWQDSVRHEFEEEHLESLVPLVRDALRAMERLGQVLAQLHQECT